MAEYRRFISYMYLYEDGRKTINSGFVRVESRDGQCRVSVHMTGIYGSENSSYRVYMLIRGQGGYIGIAVGELTIRQQSGNMELVMDSEHLMGTEYDLSRISGMVLLGENGRIYGTRWDDEPLETDKFVNGEQLSGLLVRFGDKNDDEAVSEAADAVDISQNSENAVVDAADAVQRNGDAAAGAADTERKFEDTAAENKTVADMDFAAEKTGEQHADENPMISEEELISAANSENTAGLKNLEKDYPENTEKSVLVASDAVLEDAELVQETEQAGTMNAYDLLMSQLPQMYPFEDDSVAACVRLELQDIGRMPMPCWIYGSNSFLLHGYYCYRHLILAKVERKREKEEINGRDENSGSGANNAYHANNEDAGREAVYLMGVPGIWQHREQYMASMFGFRKFRPVSRENHGRGAFGYWCVELKS